MSDPDRLAEIRLDNILRHLGEPPEHGIRMHPVTDDEIRSLVAEVKRLRREQGSVAGYRTADGRIHDPKDVEIIRF